MTARTLLQRDRILLLLLASVVVVWMATWPLRARLRRETARIEHETALTEATLQQTRPLVDAVKAARHRVAAAPHSFDSHMALATALNRSQDYPEAVRELRAAEALNPRSPDPHLVLAQVFDAGRLQDLAMEELRRALERDPNNTDALASLAYKYGAFGWNHDAETLLVRAIKIHPRDVRLHVTLALTYFQNESYKSAEEHLQLARRLAPSDRSVVGPLIDLYRNSHRYTEALRLIDEVMPHFSDKGDLYLERSQIFLAQHQPDQALRWADEALTLVPGSLSALYQRAMALKGLRRTQEAIRQFEQIRAKDPRVQQTVLMLGQLYTASGQSARAAAAFKEYELNRVASDRLARLTLQVVYRPGDPRVHEEMGQFYLDGGNPARAVVELKRALELQPTNSAGRDALVRALRAASRTQEADAVASTALYQPEIRLVG